MPKFSRTVPRDIFAAIRKKCETDHEVAVALALHAHGLLPDPEVQCNHRWHPVRRWRFDFAWPEKRLALESEGQVHRINKRFQADLEKYNRAQLDGWVVLRVSTDTKADEVVSLVCEGLRIERAWADAVAAQAQTKKRDG